LRGEGAGICGRCVDTPPCFDVSFAPLAYVEPVRYMVAGLKFRRHQVHARLLGTLLADTMAGREVYPDVLIPVPLHPSRLRERRFNPSAEIARVVSHRLAIPLDLRSARRLRATPRQVGLPADQRARNVRNAFGVSPGLLARRVAIIDDVMTTGATVNELARSLRKVGVERIEVWACARALL
jgi:ComF family protein